MRKNRFVVIKGLIVLAGPLLPVLLSTVILGVLGYLSAIFLIVFSAFALLDILDYKIATLSASGIFLGGMILFAVLRGVLRYGEQLSGHYLAFKLLAILRDKVFQTLRKLTPAKLETRDKGNLISLITSDIELLEVFYAHTIAPVIIAVITSIFMAFFIGGQSPILGGIAALGYCTVGIIIPLVNSKKRQPQGIAYRDSFAGANSYFLDSLRGIKEIIRYEYGQTRGQHIEELTEELDQKQELLKRGEGFTKAATDSAVYLFSATILLVGIGLMQNGQVGFENVFISFVAVMSSFGSVSAISSLSNNLLQTMASGERVLELLEEQPQTPEVESGEDISFTGASCEAIRFGYNKDMVLNNIELKLPENRIIGISGKSGSGKSTLLKLLMRFWDTEGGKITISEKDIRRINTKNLRKVESYVTQDTFLFHFTIEENIKIARPSASFEEVMEAARKAGIHDFIMSLPDGYQTNAGEFGHQLSSGERQRIGIARAFLHQAPFILLDEPTSNLDGLNEALILNALKQHSKEKTIVMVSHRASAMKIADEVYHMESGRVS